LTLFGLGWRFHVVMAGLVPAIHVFLCAEAETWMPGTWPGMTSLWQAFDKGSSNSQ
jgi:hypothetical protein